jgi:hypothetical protein
MIIKEDGNYFIGKGSIVLISELVFNKFTSDFNQNKIKEDVTLMVEHLHEKLEIKFSYIGISQRGGSIFKTTQDIFLPNKYGRVKGFLNDDKYSIRHLREIDVMNYLPQVKKNLEIVINTFMEENNVDFIDLFELTEKSLKRHIKLNKIIK